MSVASTRSHILAVVMVDNTDESNPDFPVLSALGGGKDPWVLYSARASNIYEY